MCLPGQRNLSIDNLEGLRALGPVQRGAQDPMPLQDPLPGALQRRDVNLTVELTGPLSGIGLQGVVVQGVKQNSLLQG